MSIIENKSRIGNFTSSEIVALTKSGKRDMTKEEMVEFKKLNPKSKKTTCETMFGDAAYTYIDQTNMERRLQRSLTEDVGARPLNWGKLCESFAFSLLGIEYTLSSQETSVHPTIPYWVGSIDGNKKDTVIDHKCPVTLESFCKLVDPLYNGLEGMDAMNALRNGWTDKNGFEHPKHTDAEKYFWQLVSGAIISECNWAELIIFMPYRSQLQAIRDLATNGDHEKPERFYWIANNVHDDELPWLTDNGFYKSINIIRFEVIKELKDFLTERVIAAGKMLIDIPSIVVPEPHFEPHFQEITSVISEDGKEVINLSAHEIHETGSIISAIEEIVPLKSKPPKNTPSEKKQKAQEKITAIKNLKIKKTEI